MRALTTATPASPGAFVLAGRPRPSVVFLVAHLVSLPVYCLVRLSGDPAWISIVTAVTAVSLFAFSLAHCVETRGAWRSAGMLLAAFAIAITMEYLGSAHDFIFGAYDYTDLLGLRALGVPVIIPLAWFMMLYPAWATAGLLTRGQRVARPAARPWARITIAALAMTAWDLSLDPRMVADGAWIWHNVPAINYFGIPLSNFAGWIITSALIYAVWSRLDRPNQWRAADDGAAIRVRVRGAEVSIAYFDLPIWAYIITWVGESMANALFWGGPGVAVAVFVAMGAFAAPALRLLLRGARSA